MDVGQKGETSGRMPELAVRLWSSGFTLVELIVTLILVGILAVVAIPKLAGLSAYNTLGFYDRVASGIRFAQKQAIAKRKNVCANFTGNSVTFRFASSAGAAAPCDADLTGPNGEAPYVLAPDPRGVGAVIFSPTPTDFQFDALGRPTVGQAITVTGDGSKTLSVEPETGYVRTS
jgi:MSHA pilin protein MshC